MDARAVTPILNVSDIVASIAWFEKLGWTKGVDWVSPPTFGSVHSGGCGIFLCQGAQGGRGKSPFPTTKGHGEAGDKGIWMWVRVDDVGAVHRHCPPRGIGVTMPPTDEPWGVREMYIRHPAGHVVRISKGLGGADRPASARLGLRLLDARHVLAAPFA
jgi:catechol 2,3-dioxygenase-like lactoylglutathione lyase family enzyme